MVGAVASLLMLGMRPVLAADGHTECLADLEELASFVAANDGDAEAERIDHNRTISEAYDAARMAATQADAYGSCEKILRSYLWVWRPRRLTLMSSQELDVELAQDRMFKKMAADRPGPDRYAPTFKVLDQDAVALTLPRFEGRSKAAIDQLFKDHRAELAAHKHWIINVRGNHGGSNAAYTALLPWLLDASSVGNNHAWRATAANVAAYEEACGLPLAQADCAEDAGRALRAMKDAQPGSYADGSSSSACPATI